MSISLSAYEATCIYQFVTNNHASFNLWSKENELNHQSVSQYYEHDCTFFKFSIPLNAKGGGRQDLELVVFGGDYFEWLNSFFSTC